MGNAMYRFTISEYQQWSGYPQSPELTTDFPYQCVVDDTWLLLCTNPMYVYLTSYLAQTIRRYKLVAGNWVMWDGSIQQASFGTINEANSDIYTDETLITVYFTKTTINILKIRVRNLRHYDSGFIRAQTMKHYDGSNWQRINL
jgi:hypothetical protein